MRGGQVAPNSLELGAWSLELTRVARLTFPTRQMGTWIFFWKTYIMWSYMNFFLESIHYVKCCKKFFFVCFPPGSPGTKLNKKMHKKMTTFQNNEGGGGLSIFGRFFQKIVFVKQMQYIYPPQSLVTISFIFGDTF